MATNTPAQPALLFMPDISGFTEFVNATEIMHAQSIIQEVLEIIIESNQLNMEVGEIEGDAVFFYRLGSAPTIPDLMNQVKNMFTRFHQHLRLYSLQRICPCAACSSATNLKLKIIVHFGEVAGYSVKNHHKLFGRDVIVLHRLLKNSLDKKEYALLTQPLLTGTVNYPDWFRPEPASERYDVGEIAFEAGDLSPLKVSLPTLSPSKPNQRDKTKIVFTQEDIIPAAAEKVFGTIFNLSQRPKWMDGLKQVELIDGYHINRIGTTHRCILGKKNNPLIVTESARILSDGAELVEMDKSGIGGCRYRIKSVSSDECLLTIDMLVKKNFFLLTLFQLFMKKRYQKQIERSINNLKEFCKDPFVRKRTAMEHLN
jgi:hypothetical protein